MIKLSEGQQKTIAGGLTLLAVVAIAGFVALVGWLFVKVLQFAAPALIPVVVGVFLAMFFKPYYSWWLKLVKNPTFAVLLMLLSIGVPLGILLFNFGSFAAAQTTDLIEAVPTRIANFQAWFNATLPNAKQIADKFNIPYMEWTDSLRIWVGNSAVGVVGYASSFLSVLLALIFFVYFLTRPNLKGVAIVRQMPFLKEDTKLFVSQQIDTFIDIVVTFSQRQMCICLLEGFLYGMGFALVGLSHGFIIGFALGLFNFVPLLGTVAFLPIALLVAYFGAGGSLPLLLMVLGVWLVGQILDGYLITPKIQGDKTGLGYAGVIFSFFFWGIVFNSFLGLLLAIPLSAFCAVLWRAIKAKYIKPVV